MPRPAETVKGLYRFLKKGGQMIVYEHVGSEDFVSGVVQRKSKRGDPAMLWMVMC